MDVLNDSLDKAQVRLDETLHFILFMESLENYCATNNTYLKKTKAHSTEFGTPLVAAMVDFAKSGKSTLAKQAFDRAAKSDRSQVASDEEVSVKAFVEDSC